MVCRLDCRGFQFGPFASGFGLLRVSSSLGGCAPLHLDIRVTWTKLDIIEALGEKKMSISHDDFFSDHARMMRMRSRAS